MLERFFAAVGLLICLALALQMALPYRWRSRMLGWRARLIVWWRDPLGHKARHIAREAAESAIRRAQRSKRWKGNVYKLGDPGEGDDDGDDENQKRTLH